MTRFSLVLLLLGLVAPLVGQAQDAEAKMLFFPQVGVLGLSLLEDGSVGHSLFGVNGYLYRSRDERTLRIGIIEVSTPRSEALYITSDLGTTQIFSRGGDALNGQATPLLAPMVRANLHIEL